jgi:hypothetical protein
MQIHILHAAVHRHGLRHLLVADHPGFDQRFQRRFSGLFGGLEGLKIAVADKPCFFEQIDEVIFV